MNSPADPRAAPVTLTPNGPVSIGVNYPADYVIFRDLPPADRDGTGSRHWYGRGQNFVVAYSDCAGPVSLSRAAADQPDEWMLLLPGHDTGARIAAAGQIAEAPGHSLTVIPAGASSVEISGSGPVVRIMSRNAADLCALAHNAGSYQRDHANVTPLAPWPAPPDGPRVRVYSLDVPRLDGRFGRIFRCTTIMVNVLYPAQGPRDETRMSPHSHADFEQGSLALAGEYIHHLRWPWTADRRAWREDEHRFCPSPSVAIIPPPAIHTSQSLAAGINHLIDIFAPPRVDFSLKPGWVLNADEYPMPVAPARAPDAE
jgi:hypothetical protein